MSGVANVEILGGKRRGTSVDALTIQVGADLSGESMIALTRMLSGERDLTL